MDKLRTIYRIRQKTVIIMTRDVINNEMINTEAH